MLLFGDQVLRCGRFGSGQGVRRDHLGGQGVRCDHLGRPGLRCDHLGGLFGVIIWEAGALMRSSGGQGFRCDHLKAGFWCNHLRG